MGTFCPPLGALSAALKASALRRLKLKKKTDAAWKGFILLASQASVNVYDYGNKIIS